MTLDEYSLGRASLYKGPAPAHGNSPRFIDGYFDARELHEQVAKIEFAKRSELPAPARPAKRVFTKTKSQITRQSNKQYYAELAKILGFL